MVDWFVLDTRGIDQTSAARLLPKQVTPAEIADPVEAELRSFLPKDIADIVAAVLAAHRTLQALRWYARDRSETR